MVREFTQSPMRGRDSVDDLTSAASNDLTRPQAEPSRPSLSALSGRSDLLARGAFLAVSAYAFAAGMRVYEGAGIWVPAILLGLILYVGALLALLGAFWSRNPNGHGAQMFLASVILIALVSSVAFEISVVNRSYGTDAIAFAHVGGEVLLRGDNPYAVVGKPLAPIVERFGVPETFVTRTTSGDPIERLISYPGGHVLAYTGALALGLDDLRWATLVFEVAALAVIWWALSRQARLLVPLVLLVEPNLTVYFTSGGVTDWLWVLPLTVSAIMLHRQRWGYAGLALGIACAIKQQPWFALPFVFVWAFMHIRKTGNRAVIRRELGALTAGTLAGFAVLNLPFAMWDLPNWFGGVFSPILDNLVPDGQGLSLLASRGFVPIPQVAFSVAMIVGFALSILIYYRRFDRLRNLLWVLPAALLFLSHRSLHNYFIYWIPVAALWLDLETRPRHHPTIGDVAGQPNRLRRAVVLIGAVLLGASFAFGLYFASAASIAVGSVRAEMNAGVVTALDVELTNKGDEPLQPVVEIYWGRYPVPWEAITPTVIEPNESAVVRVVPTGRGVIPPLRMNDDGVLQPRPFRVRVNDDGESGYASSSLVRLGSVQESVVNPEFLHWGATGGMDPAPYWWTSAEIAQSGTLVQTRTLGSGRGVSMTVAQVDQSRAGWGEAALIQEVAGIDSCYRLQVAYDYAYSANAEGRPLAAAGLQILQGNSAVWFVLSDVQEIRVTRLPEQTRIVEVPMAPGQLQDIMFEMTAAGEGSGIQVGQRGTIKLFSALNESEPGPLELRVASITDCP